MACGEMGPIDGGLIRNSTIQDSTITGSTFTGGEVVASEIQSGSLEDLANVDGASARTIAAAIAGEPSAIAAIAAAVNGGNPASYGSPAAAAEAPDLPTAMYGTRDAVLGQPAAWMQLGDYVVPLFRKA